MHGTCIKIKNKNVLRVFSFLRLWFCSHSLSIWKETISKESENSTKLNGETERLLW